MNVFTLVFQNRSLEESYQSYYYNQFRIQIYKLAQQYFFALAGLMIASIQNMDHYVTSFCVSVAITHIVILYNWERIKTDYIYYYYNTLICTGPELIIGLIYFTGNNQIITFNLILVLLAFPTVFIKSNNVLMATLQILHYYVMAVISLIYFIDMSLYILSWFPMCILWIYSYYIQVRNDRDLYQKAQINKSIYELIKQITKEEFIIFEFNEEKSKYEPECTNITNLDLPRYLMGFHILEKKCDLSFYLFDRYIKVNQSHDIAEVIIGYQKAYSQSLKNLELYIQTYPKLKFLLKVPVKKQSISQILLKEHYIINRFFKQISNSLLRNPNDQIQRILNQLKLLISIRRQHFVLPRYQLTKAKIQIRVILDQIARDFNLEAHIVGYAEIINDTRLLIQLLQAMYILVQINNTKVQILIEDQGDDAYIRFQFNNPIKNLSKIKKSTLMVYTNELFSIVSNGFIQLDKLQILLLIIPNPDIPFK